MELNLVEKLKYCPKGTKLWSVIYGEVEFSRIASVVCAYPINAYYTNSKGDKTLCAYTPNGKEMECHNLATLFPSKENHDWNSVDWSMPEVAIPDVGEYVVCSDNCNDWFLDLYGGLDTKGIHMGGVLTVDGIKPETYWAHIIPMDKFNIHNIEESLKYDLIKLHR